MNESSVWAGMTAGPAIATLHDTEKCFLSVLYCCCFLFVFAFCRCCCLSFFSKATVFYEEWEMGTAGDRGEVEVFRDFTLIPF